MTVEAMAGRTTVAHDEAAALRDHPDWPWARSVQSARARELLTASGAHGLDIGWVDHPDGSRAPGLVFHVAPDGLQRAAEAIPATIEVVADDGRHRRIRTRVDVVPAVHFEPAQD